MKRILVIEDEPQMRAMLTDNLEFDGYQVTAVASGEEGLRAFADSAFSLLLLDIMLPGISGFDVCRTLRAQGTRVPIILLTARTHERDRVKGLDLGADDYVSKPFGVTVKLACENCVSIRASTLFTSSDRSAGSMRYGRRPASMREKSRMFSIRRVSFFDSPLMMR